MSTFDYIANSLNVKGNVIKKCIHSEQQIEFIMELNRAVVQCPNCHAKTDRIKDYRWQRIAIGSILHQQAFVRLHKKKIRFALAAVVHSLKPSRSCSVYQRKSKRSADADYGVVFFKSAASQI